MNTLRIFEDPRVRAHVEMLDKGDDWLELDEQGVITIPEDVKPKGFYLTLYVPEKARLVITQKNLRREKGGYHDVQMTRLESLSDKRAWVQVILEEPILVQRQGQQTWVPYKGLRGHPEAMPSNRVDIWLISEDGGLDLFQAGVVTHDDGKTFRLLGEYRWRGRIYRRDGAYVAKPKKPFWGDIKTWNRIFENLEFQDHLRKVSLEQWQGKDEDLSPQLEPPPEGYARMKFYIPFMGQTGQGLALLPSDSTATAWVHGIDIKDPPEPDGIKRLRTGDLVSHAGTGPSGSNGGIRLLCVEKA